VIWQNEIVWEALRYAGCFALSFRCLVIKELTKRSNLNSIFKIYFADYQIANENFPWMIDFNE